MPDKTIKKRFIVRKYVMATSVSHALRLEKKVPPDDCFVDDEWMKANPKHHGRQVGF